MRYKAFALVADIDRSVVGADSDDGAVDDFAFFDLLLLLGSFEELGEIFVVVSSLRVGFFRTGLS